MVKITAFFTALLLWFNVAFFPAAPVEGVFGETAEKVQTEFDEGEFVMGENDLVVAPYGDDNNAGTLEAPLKTFEKAKELLKNNTSDEAVTVWFREGAYLIEDTVEFTADDRSNVLYRSYPDEEVSFTGAKEISGWSETTINGVNAFVTDMPVESDSDYFRSLFKGNKRLSRPNYPETDVFKVAAEPLENEKVVSEWDGNFFVYSPVVYAHPEDMLDFENPTDIDLKLMHFWCEDLMPVLSIDKDTGRIVTEKATAMKTRVNDNYILENVKEALNSSGEWYLDRDEEKLYYIPENGDTVENTVLYAAMTEQLLTINGAENISFQGISFEKTDWDHIDGKHTGKPFDPSSEIYKVIKYGTEHPQAAFEVPAAIYITASSGINFTDCRFENISYSAVKFDKGAKDCNITSSLFNEIGGNAVFIHGDFVVPATTQRINVTDCHIGYYGRIFNNAIGILLTQAYDCELSNNEIHDGWYTGVSVGWNWGYTEHPTNKIKICNNLIYNIGNAWLSDMGGIYTLGVQPDTVISGNIIYNVGCDEGAYGYGGWGIYLDEGSSGMLVENNLVYDCSSQTFHQHYGKDNIIRNNIFAFGGDGAFRITRNEEHNSLTLSNNILVTDNATMYALTTERDWFVDNSNLYWDYKHGGNVYSGDSMGLFERKSLVILTLRGYYNNAVFENPLFKDAENRDFTLAENSPALEAGFKPFAYDAGTITKF